MPANPGLEKSCVKGTTKLILCSESQPHVKKDPGEHYRKIRETNLVMKEMFGFCLFVLSV